MRRDALFQLASHSSSLSCRSPGFHARVGLIPEIPALVIDAHRCHIVGRKWNFLVSADLDDAAFAYSHLLENSSILELHGNDMIAETGLFRVFQMFRTPTGNGYQPFHCNPPAEVESITGSRIVRYGDGPVHPAEAKDKRTHFRNRELPTRRSGFTRRRFTLASFDYLGGRDLPRPSKSTWSRDKSPAPTVARAKLPASIASGNS